MLQPIATFEHKGYTVNIYPETQFENPREEWDHATHMYAFSLNYKSPDEHTYLSPQELVKDMLTFDPALNVVHDTDKECDYSDNMADYEFAGIYASDTHIDELMADIEDVPEAYIPSNILIYQLNFGYRWSGVGMSEYDVTEVELSEGYIYMTGEEIVNIYGDKELWKGSTEDYDALIEDLKDKDWAVDSIPEEWVGKARDLIKVEVEEFNQYLEGCVYHVTVDAPNGEIVDSCGCVYGLDHAIELGKEMVPDEPYIQPLHTTHGFVTEVLSNALEVVLEVCKDTKKDNYSIANEELDAMDYIAEFCNKLKEMQ